jgi:hypothetical protein
LNALVTHLVQKEVKAALDPLSGEIIFNSTTRFIYGSERITPNEKNEPRPNGDGRYQYCRRSEWTAFFQRL